MGSFVVLMVLFVFGLSALCSLLLLGVVLDGCLVVLDGWLYLPQFNIRLLWFMLVVVSFSAVGWFVWVV